MRPSVRSDSAIPREVYEGNFRYDLFHGYGVMRRPWFRDQGLGAQGNARPFRQSEACSPSWCHGYLSQTRTVRLTV